MFRKTDLSDDITAPAKDKIDNHRAQSEDKEHQGVEVSLADEFVSSVVEDVCQLCKYDSLYRINCT